VRPWSYDHLDDTETALLERCSVFASGFDLQSACAVAGFDDSDDYVILDTHNPYVLANALYVHGYAILDTDPVGALAALRRGLVIAQDNGNRFTEPRLENRLSRVEAEHGDPLAALDYVTLAIRNFHDAGNTTTIRVPPAVLAAFLDRRGRHEAAATIAGARSIPSRAQPFPRSTPRSPTSARSSATGL
jgi:hypothetical protein